MYSVVLMTALTASAESPDCWRRHQVCYCQPVMTYYYPCDPSYAADGGQDGQQTAAAFTEADVQELKAAGATEDQIKELKKLGYGHDDLKDALDEVKKANKPAEPFTVDDVATLKAAGATEDQIKELKKLGYGHDDLKDALDEVKKANKDEVRHTPAPATIVVRLPADARLTVDDAATASRSGRRRFVSPTLAPGRQFTYTFKAERMVDGVKETVTQQVTVLAGRESLVTLSFPKGDVAKK